MVTVVRSTVINAPIDEVWAFLRDFNAHDQWHPAVAESHIEEGKAPDQVGCVRNFRLADGAQLREQLLALDDRHRTYTYCILDSPIPLVGYVSTVTLKPVSDGNRTFWHWRSTFHPPPERAAELARMVGEDIYVGGFAAARRFLEGERATASGAVRRPAPRARIGTPTGTLQARAIVMRAHGGPEVLRVEEVRVPPPGPGEVRIRQTAIGLNYIDVYVRTGAYPLLTPPGTPGMEAAGEVLDVGPDVIGILPGDRVAYACPPVGAYAEIRTMAADQLVVVPEDIDDAAAAALMLKGMSAEYLLHRTHAVKRGDTILVHAAAGGVGLLLCQWAKHIGATVIGTVSSDEKARLARDNGCDYPIVTAREDFIARVGELTKGRGCDVVYDSVGAATFAGSLAALARCGHIVSYGQSSGPVPPVDPAALSAKSATLSRPVLFHYTADPAALREIAGRTFDALRRGIIRASINQRFALRDAATAHRELEARRTTGASVLLP
jgi:NADPH:quinone reductase-like Zn-dependent oxidoreductase